MCIEQHRKKKIGKTGVWSNQRKKKSDQAGKLDTEKTRRAKQRKKMSGIHQELTRGVRLKQTALLPTCSMVRLRFAGGAEPA